MNNREKNIKNDSFFFKREDSADTEKIKMQIEGVEKLVREFEREKREDELLRVFLPKAEVDARRRKRDRKKFGLD